MGNNSPEQPINPEHGRGPEKIEVAFLTGEERGPLPEYVTDQACEELLEADRLPAKQLGGMLAICLPAEDLRTMVESCILADKEGRLSDQIRNRVYEQRLEVLREFYQVGHDERMLPGKVFRDVDGKPFVASLASHDESIKHYQDSRLWSSGNNLYFHDGHFWYENGQSDNVGFRPDAASTNAAMAAFCDHVFHNRGPTHIECLPGTYPARFTMREDKLYQPTSKTIEEVLQGGSLGEVAANFVNQERHTLPGYYLAHARVYDGERWKWLPALEARPEPAICDT